MSEDRLQGGKGSVLHHPVDAASLVAFRVAYGLVMLWEVYRYLSHDWVASYWIEPDFHFKYRFFEWVHPWPGEGMYLHFYAMGALALLVTVGLFYRLAAALLWLAFTYTFLLEQATYLNHFYLVSLIGFLMIFVPAHRVWSVDAVLRPTRRSSRVPAWSVWLLRFQVGVPYFFGGLAKCTGDWLRGEPMRDWLQKEDDFPLIGRFFDEEWMVYFFSWSGLLIDLLCVPFLLIRRTRAVAFGVLILFHFTNTRLFSIGIFPWFMMAATAIFFDPDWPRRIWQDVWGRPSRRGVITLVAFALGGVAAGWFKEEVEILPSIIGAVSLALCVWHFLVDRSPVVQSDPSESPTVEPAWSASSTPVLRACTTLALGVWAAAQCVLPLRHYWIPGNVHWTEDGHRFAWHMKLRDKDGSVYFQLLNPATGETRGDNPRSALTSRQYRKMSTRPYMIRQYARHLAEVYRREHGWEEVEVYARSEVSLNGRPREAMVDPEANLADVPYSYGRTPWILELETPLGRVDDDADATQIVPGRD